MTNILVAMLRREAKSTVDCGIGDGWPYTQAADMIEGLLAFVQAAADTPMFGDLTDGGSVACLYCGAGVGLSGTRTPTEHSPGCLFMAARWILGIPWDELDTMALVDQPLRPLRRFGE